MARIHVDHGEIVRFAQDRVNLPRGKADEYRAQAWRLREKLNGYLKDHADFTLRKMLLSGGLAKSRVSMSMSCRSSMPEVWIGMAVRSARRTAPS